MRFTTSSSSTSSTDVPRSSTRSRAFVAPPASPAQAGLIDFTAERERHVRFVGCDDVMARLDEWLLGAKATRWVFVTGGPGMDKSAILAAGWPRSRHSRPE